MSHLELTVTRRIHATPQRVWDIVSDIEHSPNVISGIERVELLTGKNVMVGMRWNETRMMFGRESTELLEITSFEPPHAYVVEAHSCGAHMLTEIRCESAENDSTDLTITLRTKPTTFLSRLLKPLAKLAMKSIRKHLNRDLDDIAAAATN